MKWQTVALIACAASAAGAFAQDSTTLAYDAARAYRDKQYAQCVQLYSAVIDKGSRSSMDRYHCASCLVLMGRKDEAFKQLDAALALGLTRVDDLAEDTDFASLHGDPRWPTTLERMRSAQTAYLESANAELANIRTEDQADRRPPIDWQKLRERDAVRYRRVKELIAADALKVAEDYFNAALVMQHGSTVEDYELAHQLASRAAELKPDHRSARWLASAAKDRWLWQQGKPQIYGTQFKRASNDSPWTMEPFDRTTISDDERRAAGVGTLAEIDKRMEQRNSKP